MDLKKKLQYINYLDLSIKKLDSKSEFPIYRKPTATDNIINYF